MDASAPDEAALLGRARDGDESAFVALVERYQARVVRVAGAFVRSPAVAEDVAQDAWMAVLEGLADFEGRGAFRSWLLSITANLARKRAKKEARVMPLSAVNDDGEGLAAVDPSRFLGETERWAGHWSAPPSPWADPDRALSAAEVRTFLRGVIDALPEAQREVIVMRDIHQLEAPEVCSALGLSEANQRVLLHRARSRVRQALEDHFGGTP
jgi:RNA polymerase sigma-70 factor (ECF subfamily)